MAVGAPEMPLNTSEQSLVLAQLQGNGPAQLLWV